MRRSVSCSQDGKRIFLSFHAFVQATQWAPGALHWYNTEDAFVIFRENKRDFTNLTKKKQPHHFSLSHHYFYFLILPSWAVFINDADIHVGTDADTDMRIRTWILIRIRTWEYWSDMDMLVRILVLTRIGKYGYVDTDADTDTDTDMRILIRTT